MWYAEAVGARLVAVLAHSTDDMSHWMKSEAHISARAGFLYKTLSNISTVAFSTPSAGQPLTNPYRHDLSSCCGSTYARRAQRIKARTMGVKPHTAILILRGA